MRLRRNHGLALVILSVFCIAATLRVMAEDPPAAGQAEQPRVGADHDDHDHVADADQDDAGHDGHDHAADAGQDDADHDDHGHAADAGQADAGQEGHDHGADAGDDDEDHEDVVKLSPAEVAEFGIRVDVAGPGTLESSLELPGEVRPNDDRLAHIVPRYSGIALEVRAKIGDYVRRGQVLAIIESDESLAPFEVKTLISGTVIGKHITLGEAASRERDAFVIADLSTVWIDLTVYQGDLDEVEVGQAVDVYVGHELRFEGGTVSYVTPIVDEHTRTATARVVLPNKGNEWRPGMFVTGKVLVERADVPLVVASTALHRMEGGAVVFLETPSGFLPQRVVVGRRGGKWVEVVSGISPGQRYVSKGGFTIKAELEKGGFGHAGHAH